ncbi:phosphotransferase family protein [Paenibacillus cremeus]|uniref:Phosphotransferase n=1 Tax=Paenibacillus cremeus TaxID=2163881 RepID=A0A559KH81_9BACL|nr:phosphotransferase [Paenibacillus cremeus]TVY11484.1 phosphotransferase [Paenibacillus cremeus]
MDIHEIIEELQRERIVPAGFNQYTAFSGGTNSQVGVLNDGGVSKVVIKQNQAEVLRSEADFLAAYAHLSLLPQLRYTDPAYRFIVYEFIPGNVDTSKITITKRELLVTLIDRLINRYEHRPDMHGWGWIDALAPTWRAFLEDRVASAIEIIGSRLEPESAEVVQECVKQTCICVDPEGAYLLHGDCGVHNFIFHEGRLQGVIDPTPVIGPPLYDLSYAFYSSPEELEEESFIALARLLQPQPFFSEKQLYEEALIGLYLRMGTCLVHHPHDFEAYAEAWYRLRRRYATMNP